MNINFKSFCAVLFIFLLFIYPAFSDFTEENTLSLSVRECILRALANNPDILIYEYGIEQTAQAVQKQEARFDPSFSAEAYYRDAKSHVSSGTTKTDVIDALAQITKKTKTGSEFSLTHSLSRSKTDPVSSSALYNPSFSSDLSASFTQPLLKNSGQKVNTALIRIENNNKDISGLDFKRSVISIISSVQKYYWDLAYYIENYKIRKQALSLAEDLYNNNSKKVELGALAPIEITRAEAGVAQEMEKIITAENSIYAAHYTLLSHLNLIDSSYYTEKIITPVKMPEPVLEIPDVKKSFELAVKNDPAYNSLLKQIENSGIRIYYYENQHLPALDFKATYSLSGSGSRTSKSYGNLTDYPSRRAGFVFTVPLGRRSSGADIETERLNELKLLARLKKQENDINAALRIKIRDLAASVKQIQAAEKSVRLAEENLAAEMKKFELNQSTTYDVLQFQNALSEAKARLLKAVIDNKKAHIDFEAITGLILETSGIEL